MTRRGTYRVRAAAVALLATVAIPLTVAGGCEGGEGDGDPGVEQNDDDGGDDGDDD
ncbi:MAG TPA: hypothetical protein VGD67_07205 [Pseudonocardiaceae bacterium]